MPETNHLNKTRQLKQGLGSAILQMMPLPILFKRRHTVLWNKQLVQTKDTRMGVTIFQVYQYFLKLWFILFCVETYISKICQA
jgi:hypothetical protein